MSVGKYYVEMSKDVTEKSLQFFMEIRFFFYFHKSLLIFIQAKCCEEGENDWIFVKFTIIVNERELVLQVDLGQNSNVVFMYKEPFSVL